MAGRDSWHHDDGRERDGSVSRERGAFVWPPRGAGDAGSEANRKAGSSVLGQESSATDLTGGDRRVDQGPDHDSAATMWLGQIREPLRVRLARAGLDLDNPSPYCPRCGVSISPGEVGGDDPGSGCHHCHRVNLAWDRFVRLGEYESELRRVVLDVKFAGWRELGEEMGFVAGQHLMRRLELAGLAHVPITLIPIPMHFLRRMARGVDHTACICRGVARATGGRVVTALRSRSWRYTQLDVVASQREAHARASVAVSRWPHPGRLARAVKRGRVVVIVDDVKTTGSTLGAGCRRVRELVRAVQPEGYKTLLVWGLTLAVTQPGREV